MRDLQDMKHTLNSRLRERNQDFELIEGMKINEGEEMLPEGQEKMFIKKQAEIRQLKKETEALQIVNPYEEKFERKTDLSFLIYESKQKVRVKDNSKFHPEGHFSENIRQLFVTDMQDDVLN